MPNSGLQNIYIMYGDSIPNYFNRRILFYSSLEDYLTAAGDNYELHEEVNFNPADGVNTYLDVVTDMGDKFSYLLLVDPEDGTILSRWFILEADRNLGGQYRFTLKRDVVAESIINQDFSTKSPVYVEKGILSDSDPMIVNPEGMTFNQIKRSELLLDRGSSGWGWIIGYIQTGASANNITVNATSVIPEDVVTAAQLASASGIDISKINDLLIPDGNITIPIATSNISLVFGIEFFNSLVGGNYKNELWIKNDDLNAIYDYEWSWQWSWDEKIGAKEVTVYDLDTACKAAKNYIESHTETDMLNALNDVIDNDIPNEKFYSNSSLEALRYYEGRKILIGGKYYVIEQVYSAGTIPHSEVVVTYNENSYFQDMVSAIVTNPFNTYKLYINYTIQNIGIRLSEYSLPETGTYTTKISNSALPLEDAPYTMFAIPYGDPATFLVTEEGAVANRTTITKNTALSIASAIATSLDQQLFDIQLLPYAPPLGEFTLNIYNVGGGKFIPILDVSSVAYVYDPDTQTYVSTGKEGIYFDFIKDSNNDNIGAILYLQSSNFSFSINQNDKRLVAADNPKIESQCNFYRLCSPNYNGVFEFNLAKNGMSVDSFNVNCTYKPYNPLIRIQPSFKGLYGSNFIDGRGLICGGDFSLPIVKEAWTNYQLNNKNFANVFARDIENLDFMQKQEAFTEAITAGAGTVGAGASGAAIGGKLGGGWGALAGGIIGTGVGAAGGAIDLMLGGARRAEAKDYAIDRFNMNLASIKALPQTLVRNSSFSIINKIFPFVEYYSCTDEEKQALQRKIDLDGMTVGRIDYIGSFMSGTASNYFKGQLIRAEGLEEDTHYINALYEEIAKGVYI